MLQAIAGKLADAESMIALKDLVNALGSGNTVHEVRLALAPLWTARAVSLVACPTA